MRMEFFTLRILSPYPWWEVWHPRIPPPARVRVHVFVRITDHVIGPAGIVCVRPFVRFCALVLPPIYRGNRKRLQDIDEIPSTSPHQPGKSYLEGILYLGSQLRV